jgi:hypothetical protein
MIAASGSRLHVAVVVGLALGLSSARAVDFRWTQGYAQGTVEAIIRNARGSSVNIYCPSGQPDHTPGMFVMISGMNPVPREQVTAQIIVDGRNYPFDLDGQQFLAASRSGIQDLQALVSGLAASRARSFTVEVPKYGQVETFSLADAGRALGMGRTSMLKGCLP